MFATVAQTAISFNYTTVLNIIFLVVAAVLVRRFLRTGGPKMLRMMNMPAMPAAAMPSMDMHHG